MFVTHFLSYYFEHLYVSKKFKFINSRNINFMYCVIGTVLGTRHIVENQAEYNLCPCRVDILEKKKHQQSK